VYIEYRDANNVLYEGDIDLEMKILAGEKVGVQKQSGATYFVVVLVIVVVVFFFWRRRKKR
jgi:ABC-type Mn2+/Zn2+ transport system permease subunit